MKTKLFRTVLVFALIISFSVLLSCGKKNVHRSIAVHEVEGTVIATGVEKNGQLIKGEHLVSGDGVDVAAESDLTICADNSKYMYADPLTRFHIETSDAQTSNIRIVMDAGTTLHHLTEPLEQGDSYEVDTPNSTMAARGTRFRVTVYRDEAGDSFTLLEVYEGKVFVRLRTELGEFTGEEATLQPGDYAVIYGNEELSEFIINKKKKLDDEGKIYWDFDQNDADDDGITALIGLLTEIDPEFEYTINDPSSMVVVEHGSNENNSGEGKGSAGASPEGSETSASTPASESESQTSSSESESTASTSKSGTSASASAGGSSTSTSRNGTSASTSKNGSSTSTSKNGSSASTSKNGSSTSTSKNGSSASTSKSGSSASNSVASSASDPGNTTPASQPQSQAPSSNTGSQGGTSASASNSVATSTGTPSTPAEKPEPEPEHVHTPGDWQITIAPNCTNAGQRVRRCTGCGETMVTETVAATGHNGGDWQIIKNPTCEQEGVRIKKCTVCSAEVAREAVAATGHSLGQWITTKAATCEQTGIRVRKCTVCNAEIETETIIATGHSEGDWKIVTAPDCIHAGEREKTCRVCGKVTTTETVKALGHDMQVKTEVAANCTTDGYKVLKCSRCPEEERMSNGKALGHHMVKDTAASKAATCEEPGFNVMVCDRDNCPDKVGGKAYSETTSVAATGHKFIDNWVVVRDATCQSTGERVRACVNAGCHYGTTGGAKTETETIPADTNKHVWSDSPTKLVQSFFHGVDSPNRDEIMDYECTVCGAAKGDAIVTRAVANEHNWVAPFGAAAGSSPVSMATCSHGNLYDNTKCSICSVANPDTSYTVDDGILDYSNHDQWGPEYYDNGRGCWVSECACGDPSGIMLADGNENGRTGAWHGP